MKLQLTLAVLLVSLLSGPSHAQPSVVACDLVDQRVAASLLSENIRQHSPNRQTQAIEGATLSTCVFFAERSSLVVKLLDYPSKMEAKRAFATSTASGGAASFSAEPRLGEAAAWWKIGTEGYGFVVQTGNRVLMIDTRWKDSNSGAGLKERLRPTVEAAVRRL